MKKRKQNYKNKTIKKEGKKANSAIFPTSQFDPQGSYTGCPVDGGKPMQDVDDL